MPTLEERINSLYLRTGQVITEDFFANLVDVLKDMAKRGAVTYEGYVTKDLVPVSDLEIELGSPTLRFFSVHTGYGYFTYDVIVRGRTIEELIEELAPAAGPAVAYSAVDEYGYAHTDIKPIEDLALELGLPDLRWKDVYAGYGVFTYDVIVRGKTIEELISEAAPTVAYSAVDVEGYAHKDIKPIEDLALELGLPDLRWRDLYAGYGHFTYDVFVSGKRVLKDGDPIYVADIYAAAREKITQAIDYAKVTGYTAELPVIRSVLEEIKADVSMIEATTRSIYSGYSLVDIYSKLTRIEELLTEIETLITERGKPKLLAYKVNYPAPTFADIFSPDVIVERDGRVRIKITMAQGGYAYVKHVPAPTTEAIIAALCGGAPLSGQAWYEFDFTALKDDKINVRVVPGQNVTVILYNIEGT